MSAIATQSSWTLSAGGTPSANQRVYRRPLGLTELGFYWDAAFNGTADALHQISVQAAPGQGRLFADDRIRKVWTALKHRHPLLCARTEARDDGSEVVDFVLEERRLTGLYPGELLISEASSDDEVHEIIESLLNGPRALSLDLLAQLHVVKRTDVDGLFHIIFNLAHCMSDGISHATLARSILDMLSRPPEALQPFPELEERLALCVSSESVMSSLKLSRARFRWRKAMAHVMFHLAQSKIQGGQTLPQIRPVSSPPQPAGSGLVSVSLTPALTRRIIQSCRTRRITFGHALPVLAQVAMSRVLHRLHNRGQIARDEWEYRLRQPMHTGGPINLRPYLDKKWNEAGGQSEVVLSISFFSVTLPFMPRPTGRKKDVRMVGGAPHPASMLSDKRFLLRANLVKKQTEKLMRHPLFLEMGLVRTPGRIERTRAAALQWQEVQDGLREPPSGEPQGTKHLVDGVVLAHGGSSMGNIDAIRPARYPLSSNHPLAFDYKGSGRILMTMVSKAADTSAKALSTPPVVRKDESTKTLLTLLSSSTHLHCRPGELYLGASASQGKMHLTVFWDTNTYEKGLVKEWLGEVQAAAQWYLGRDDVEEEREQARL